MPKKNVGITKDYFDQQLKQQLKDLGERLTEKLDWLIGAFRKFDTEQTLLSGRVSDHEDRIEILEKKAGIQTS